MDHPIPSADDKPSAPLTDVEQRELETIANEFCDEEFKHLWEQVKEETNDISKRELAEEFFYQGVLALLAVQKLEDKEIEEQEARRFQYE